MTTSRAPFADPTLIAAMCAGFILVLTACTDERARTGAEIQYAPSLPLTSMPGAILPLLLGITTPFGVLRYRWREPLPLGEFT